MKRLSGSKTKTTLIAARSTNKRREAPSNRVLRGHTIDTDSSQKTLFTPTKWICEESGTTDELYCCCGCGHIFSEGSVAKHVEATKKKHLLFLEMNAADGSEAVVLDSSTGRPVPAGVDTAFDELSLLRSVLSIVQCVGSPAPPSPSSSVETVSGRHRLKADTAAAVPLISRAALTSARQADKRINALALWRSSLALRVFNAWRSFSWDARALSHTASAAATAATAAAAAAAAAGQRAGGLCCGVVGDSSSSSSSGATFASPLPPPPLAAMLQRSMSSVAPMRTGRTGLRNLGNTCYINAVLQALLHVPAIAIAVRSKVAGEEHSEDDRDADGDGEEDEGEAEGAEGGAAAVASTELSTRKLSNSAVSSRREKNKRTSFGGHNSSSGSSSSSSSSSGGGFGEKPRGRSPATLRQSLRTLAEAMLGDRHAATTPHAVQRCVWRELPQFAGYRQQDADEFLRAVLGLLEAQGLGAALGAALGYEVERTLLPHQQQHHQQSTHHQQQQQQQQQQCPTRDIDQSGHEAAAAAAAAKKKKNGSKERRASEKMATTSEVSAAPASRKSGRRKAAAGSAAAVVGGTALLPPPAPETKTLAAAACLVVEPSISWQRMCGAIALELPADARAARPPKRARISGGSSASSALLASSSRAPSSSSTASAAPTSSTSSSSSKASDPLVKWPPSTNTSSSASPTPVGCEQALVGQSGGGGGGGGGGVPLAACFASVVATQSLEGHEAFCAMTTQWSELPPALLLSVNRTDWSQGGRPQKLHAHLDVPLAGLDMAPFMAPARRERQQQQQWQLPTPSSSSSSPDPPPPPPPPPPERFPSAAPQAVRTVYDLQSFVVHHGRALGQGHYTAYALVHENWYHFDDERVKPVAEHDAKAAAGQATILCFTRRRQRVSS